jgi:hypothetical protein
MSWRLWVNEQTGQVGVDIDRWTARNRQEFDTLDAALAFIRTSAEGFLGEICFKAEATIERAMSARGFDV